MLRTNLFLLSLILLLAAGCSPFAHLTRVDLGGPAPHGPLATDCGQCHIEQHQEWQASAHATAFTNPRFQAAIAGNGEECLGCHAPETVRTKGAAPQARRYHLADGVSCVACHLDQGAMTGPEAGSALFTPHPIRQDQPFFHDSALCGTCHQETFAAWQASSRANPATPTCQQCHMPEVSRTATKGTNPFSRALVAFEAAQPARRHTLGVSHLVGTPGLVAMEVTTWQPLTKAPLQLTVRNLLPHPLPAGLFRNRTVRVRVTLHGRSRAVLGQGEAELAKNSNALNPGEVRTLAIPLALAPGATPTADATLTAELLLLPLAEEAALALASREFPLPPPP